EHALLIRAVRDVVGVRGDGDARAAMRARGGLQHPFDALGHAVLVGRNLEDPGPDARLADALLDVAYEEIVDRLRATRHRARTGELEEVRDLVVRVDACRNDNVEVDFAGDPRYARDVAPEPDDRDVDD